MVVEKEQRTRVKAERATTAVGEDVSAAAQEAQDEGSHGGGQIGDPQLVWQPSRVTQEWLAVMEARSVIRPQQELLWKAPDGNLKWRSSSLPHSSSVM